MDDKYPKFTSVYPPSHDPDLSGQLPGAQNKWSQEERRDATKAIHIILPSAIHAHWPSKTLGHSPKDGTAL